MSTRRAALAALAGTAMLLSACGGDDSAGGEEEVSLEFGHYYTQGEETLGEVKLMELIEEKADGSISVNVHWSEALGGPLELPGLTQDGAIDMGVISTHFLPDPYPFYRLAATSLWTDDPIAAMDIQEQIQEEIFTTEPFLQEMEENNLVPLLHQPLPAYYFIGNTPECGTDALQGKRVRTVGNDLPDMLQVHGATPVSLTTGEMYEALDRGTVDFLTIPMRHMLAYDLHEVGSHVCGPIFVFANGHTTVMNGDVWDELSDDQQAVLEEASAEAQTWFTEDSKEREEGYREQLEAEGVTFVDFPAEDLAEWADESPDFIEKWADSVGDEDGVDETVTQLRGIVE